MKIIIGTKEGELQIKAIKYCLKKLNPFLNDFIKKANKEKSTIIKIKLSLSNISIGEDLKIEMRSELKTKN